MNNNEFNTQTLNLMSEFIFSINDLQNIIEKENLIPKPKYSKKNKIKCAQCMKKLSMMSFTCKCGNMYCITHQTPHMHNCSYNYKLDLQNQIEKNNPKLGQKLIKI